MTVLISGAAGRLGRRLTRALEADHDLVLGDVAPVDDERFVPLDVTDLDAVRAATRGCDAVAHLAMLDCLSSDPEDLIRYAPGAVQVHAGGTYTMLQAAHEAGVRRFVYTSSVSAVDGMPPDTLVGSDHRHYSSSIYGMSKGFGEDICRMFHTRFGVSVAVLRLGNVYMPEAAGAWMGNVYVDDLVKRPGCGPAPSRVHVDDVTRCIALALDATEPGYSLVHVVGADSGDQWDLEAAGRLYGWEPRYSFSPDGLPHPV